MYVIGCWLKANPGTFLWLKSPIDRVKFNPLTLPWIIGTPVFAILSFSTGFYGLWSKESWTHLPSCQRAALESPALAHTILSLLIATTTAVAPAFNYPSLAGLFNYYPLYLSNYSFPGLSFIINSTWINV